jgi:hypothetical protein
MLGKTYGTKRDEVAGEWRRQHNEEVYRLYPSPNITQVMKSRIMRWAGNVACMGKGEVYTRFWWGKCEGKRPLVKTQAYMKE